LSDEYLAYMAVRILSFLFIFDVGSGRYAQLIFKEINGRSEFPAGMIF
jgi:hypothetical protein